MKLKLFQESLVHLRKVGWSRQSQENICHTSTDQVTEKYPFAGRDRNFKVLNLSIRGVIRYIFLSRILTLLHVPPYSEQ